MEKIIYTGIFVDNPTELLTLFPPKHLNVFAHHMTIEFRPSSLSGIEVGKQFILKVLGRAHDAKGDALLVESYKTTKTFPHITISCANDVSPLYSNDLLQKAYEDNSLDVFSEPILIAVTEGFFNGESDVKSL